MEQLEHTADLSTWHAYVAGFFDGEGSVSIARVRANGKSDYHKIMVTIGQRTEHAAVLDRIATDFGGVVQVQMAQSRVRHLWASYSKWQLQAKVDIRRFLVVMQPLCVIKAKPIRIGLAFIDTFRIGAPVRDSLGRINGKVLSRDEIEAREQLRLEMREANALGPPKAKPSSMPPLDIQWRARSIEEQLTLADAHLAIEGKRHFLASLEPADIAAIVATYAEGTVTQRQLGERYGVSRDVISGILTHRTYRRFTEPILD